MITLTITKAPFDITSNIKNVIIGPQGGSIGRSEEANVLVIPDPNVSRHHFKILFSNGDYLLRDTSSNGVFINESPLPVGSGKTEKLKPGDTIKVGQTEMLVTAYGSTDSGLDSFSPLPGLEVESTSATADDKSNAAPMPDAAWGDSNLPLPDSTLFGSSAGRDNAIDRLLNSAPSDDLISSLPQAKSDLFLDQQDFSNAKSENFNAIDQFLSPEKSNPNVFIPEDVDLLSASPLPTGKSSTSSFLGGVPLQSGSDQFDAKAAGVANGAIPVGEATFFALLNGGSEQNESFEQKTEAPLQETNSSLLASIADSHATNSNAQKDTFKGTSAHLDNNIQELQQALTPLLGKHAQNLNATQCITVINELSKSIGAVLPGLMESLQSRWAFKQSLHLNMTMIQKAENNPLKFSPTPETAAEMMFVHKPKGYLDAPKAFAKGVHELQTHQAAIMGALRGALMQTVQDFFSEAAIGEFAEHNKNGALLGFGKKAKLWDSYLARTNALLNNNQEELEKAFLKNLGRIYDTLAPEFD